MKVAICDDDTFYAKEIAETVKIILFEYSNNNLIDLYYDSNDLFNTDISYDIAFLDIEMKPHSGMDTAKKLKSKNDNIILFFITSYEQYLDDAMDLNAFRYIKKPLDINRLRCGIEKAIKLIDESTIPFSLKSHNESVIVLSNEIVFVEITGRSTKVQLVDKEYYSDNNIDYWSEKLIASFFYRVHKSYIINLKYISNYSRDTVVLCNHYKIPVAYRKQASFKSYFLSFLGEK